MQTDKLSKPQAIVFDVGNVLLNLDWTITAQKLGLELNSEKFENLFLSVRDWDLFHLFEKGLCSEEEFYKAFSSRFLSQISQNEFEEIWNSCLPSEVDGVAEVIQELSERYTIFGLSNTNSIHFRYFMDRFPIFRNFKKVFTSFEWNLRKPDPLIFQQLLESVALSPNQIVFFDDLPDNVAAAKNHGIQAYQAYRSAQSIRDCESLRR